MTAINLYASGPRGLLITDTAYYDSDGIVHAFLSKSLAIPRLRMALATRGILPLLPALAARIDQMASSFDDLIDNGSAFIARWYADQDHDDAIEREFELSAVGWSESRKACVAIKMFSVDIPGCKAFQWFSGTVLLGPDPHRHDLVAAGVLVNGIFDESNIEASLLKVIDIQRGCRARLGTDPSLPERHMVGGQVIVTEVTERAVSQRIARTWPDQLGQHIEPAPPANVVPMSREQQRRLKQKRRAG